MSACKSRLNTEHLETLTLNRWLDLTDMENHEFVYTL